MIPTSGQRLLEQLSDKGKHFAFLYWVGLCTCKVRPLLGTKSIDKERLVRIRDSVVFLRKKWSYLISDEIFFYFMCLYKFLVQ